MFQCGGLAICGKIVNCGLWHFDDDVGGWWLAASLAGLAKKVAAEMFEILGNINPASLKVSTVGGQNALK